MESSKLSGFKIQKTPIALGYMVTACGAQWIYGEKPGGAPSYRLMTLEPYRVKQENFDVIKEAQLYWTKLLIKISCDIDAIERLHAGTNDQTIKAFLSIARKVSQSTKKVANLFITRCDYIFNEAKQVFQQTEFNAMSVGLWTVTDPAQRFHQALQPLRGKPCSLYVEPTKDRMISAFYEVHQMYCKEYNVKKAEVAVLITATGMDQDGVEQAEIQKCLLLKKVMVIKASFNSLLAQDTLVYCEQTGTIKVNGIQISVVYYREGYSANDFMTEGSMMLREKLELSRAVCVPNINIHLLNFKNVQVQLKTTNIIKEFLPADQAERLLQVQTTIFTADQVANNKQQIIKQYGNNLAVKSIHQGSKELYFNQKAVQKLGDVDLNIFMVMEYIASAVRPVQTLISDNVVAVRQSISEVGTYGIGLFRTPEDVERNEYMGYLCRTFAESGFNLGLRALDALQLI